MSLSNDQRVELEIEKTVAGGAGLARKQGQVFLVEGALPGSTILARKTKFLRPGPWAELAEVLVPSPHACDPPCPHFGLCGGCAWQHALYASQLAFKREIVAEQLSRLGGLSVEPGPTVPSPSPLGYRNKMEFAFGPGPTLGLKARRGPDRVVEVDSCPLLPSPAMDILEAVRDVAQQSGLGAYDHRTGRGVWRHAVLRHSVAENRWLVQLIVSGNVRPDSLLPLGREVLQRFKGVVSGVILGLRKARSDYALAERRAWALGRDHLVETLGGLAFQVSAESFFQTNTGGAERLIETLLHAAQPAPNMTAWDLYCGVGSLSLPLARAGVSVDGFEQNLRAVKDATANATRNGLELARFHARDILDVLKAPPDRPDLIVLDPPRAGLHPEAPPLLAAAGARKVVYVSCDPATLARDLDRLSPAYAVESVTPVDMFPQTPHVECVAALVRR
ncbi:23S rRNA (uracil(1939)-C(5))-methyltransferase RlmD [Fundidesulfovibrio butyratiphilus]